MSLAQRWFIIGFISAIFCCSLGIGVYQWSLSKLNSVSEIDNSEFSLGSREGAEKIDSTVELIEIKFGSGEIRIDYSTGQEINWDCDGVGKKTILEKDPSEKSVRLDFSSAIVDCDITIPSRSLKIEGMHGEVELRKIDSNVEVHMINGELFLQPRKDREFKYELNVDSGAVDESFVSSPSPKALLIKAEMKYGNVESLDQGTD